MANVLLTLTGISATASALFAAYNMVQAGRFALMSDELLRNRRDEMRRKREMNLRSKQTPAPSELPQGTTPKPEQLFTGRWTRCKSASWTAIMHGRALLYPLSAFLGQWSLLFHKEAILEAVPPLYTGAFYDLRSRTTVRLHPKDILEAFRLGGIYQTFTQSGGNASEALAQASAMAGHAVSAAELQSLPELVEQMAKKASMVDRLRSTFTLVNIMWATSIVGMTVTFGPTVYILLRRYIDFGKLLKVSLSVATSAITPLTFLSSFLLTVESLRYKDSEYTMAGPMLALAGQALFWLAYTRNLSYFEYLFRGKHFKQVGFPLLLAFGALQAAPAAILHQSSLLGYTVVVPLVMSMGFFSHATSNAIWIGFHSEKALVSTAVGCASTLAVFIGLKAFGVDSNYLRPFQQAVGTFGTSVYLLALDINALQSKRPHGKILYAANLAGLMVAGQLLPMQSLSVVAQVYTGIYLFTLYCDRGFRLHAENKTLFLFSFFCTLFACAWFLNTHPEVVVAAIKGCEPPL